MRSRVHQLTAFSLLEIVGIALLVFFLIPLAQAGSYAPAGQLAEPAVQDKQEQVVPLCEGRPVRLESACLVSNV